MKLSVVIPVYNEIHTIDTVLTEVVRAIPHVPKEIVFVDDGSKDGTRDWLVNTFGDPTDGPFVTQLAPHHLATNGVEVVPAPQSASVAVLERAPVEVKVIFHKHNQGKGAALRTGFEAASGDVIIIQDADLEYDPQDWAKMWQLIADGKADVVYGSRFYGNPHRVLYFHHLLGNKVISAFVDLTCNTTLSDIEVCYKMFRREVLEGVELICNDFGFEVEFTMKVARSPRRWRMYETGISYYGRTYAEGKKINWKDGVKALGYILRFWLWR
ncbi:MAG: glycosyltransferase family 2 protein [Merismopedia sp. SIO2A8]|nr:glycosyltransferase family 2 protein [Merismopedia sp. SIO2A8]